MIFTTFDKNEFWFWCKAAVIIATPSFVFALLANANSLAMVLVIGLFICVFTAITSSAYYKRRRSEATAKALQRAFNLRKILLVVALIGFILQPILAIFLPESLRWLTGLFSAPIFFGDILSFQATSEDLLRLWFNDNFGLYTSYFDLKHAFWPTFVATCLHGIVLNLILAAVGVVFYVGERLKKKMAV